MGSLGWGWRSPEKHNSSFLDPPLNNNPTVPRVCIGLSFQEVHSGPQYQNILSIVHEHVNDPFVVDVRYRGFPGGSVVKNSPVNLGDVGYWTWSCFTSRGEAALSLLVSYSL